MTDIAKIRRLIQAFDFDGLFEELGWDRFKRSLPVAVDGMQCELTGVREKRGFQVFHYLVPEGEDFPTAATMTKVQRAVAATAHENIVIFSDAKQTRQCFRIARREHGKLLRSTGLDYHAGHSGEALAQRISRLAISLDEEEDLSLVDVVHRASELYAEKVTKKFFEKFQKQRETFKEFIKGIKDIQHQDWYASLMLNRLMFVYFVQKKGFLDRDLDYLKNRLAKSREANKDFHSFYRYFLLRLFHEGLNKRVDRRDPELEKLLGEVPYLNGGIFGEHEIEQLNSDIEIPDEAFEKLFDFFDEYQWHLDNRELRSDREINPDVLGYIFEKYINQKQMGAYYTKEDITEYISKNTILPYLLDEAARRNSEPFRPEREVWALLRDDADRYIYNAVGHGLFVNIHKGQEIDQPVPLPANIEAGIDDVSKRTDWNTAAPPEVALPTETWREHIARRERCLELRRKLSDGEVTSVNDLVTLNLDILQFAQDVIDNAESADLLRAIYYTIAGRQEQLGSNHKAQLPLSVLDPTCGSGAFLFAALNILQPLYEACLTKMQQFVADADQAQPFTVDDQVAALIEAGESSTVEFKSTMRLDVKTADAIADKPAGQQFEILKKKDNDRQHDILKAVSALLNTSGGDLVVGVDDKGNGVGIQRDYIFWGDENKQNRDNYELWMNQLFINQFGKVAAGCIEPVFAKRDGVDVVWLKITPSPDPVLVTKDGAETFYRRIGNSSQSLTMTEFAKYRDQRFKGDPPARKEPQFNLGDSQKTPTRKLKDFRDILADVEQHPNRTYFVLKSIIINNLFGVDIMPEAVEICKLRLFLQLMSTVDPHYTKPNLGVEALPDIDFNIRAGNTLVGFTSLDEIKESFRERSGLFDDKEIVAIERQVKIVSQQFKLFRLQQTQLNAEISEDDKAMLGRELATLTNDLDEFLAADYRVSPNQKKKFSEWKNSHRPFHWFAEFYAISQGGGFSAIVGNPPYIEIHKVRKLYQFQGYKTERCGNLYGPVLERSFRIGGESSRLGMIVQLSAICTARMSSLQRLLLDESSLLWTSAFDDRPGKLFDGLEHIRASIILSKQSRNDLEHLFATKLNRWYSECRDRLFECQEFQDVVTHRKEGSFPKLGDSDLLALVERLAANKKTLADLYHKNAQHLVHYYRSPLYWIRGMDFLPHFKSDSASRSVHHFKDFNVMDREAAPFVGAVINSTLFYIWFIAFGNGRNVTLDDVLSFPLPQIKVDYDPYDELFAKLMESYQDNSVLRKRRDGVEYQEFYPAKSKSIMDQIDAVLARTYQLTADELDFVVNYDIKFRMGSEND